MVSEPASSVLRAEPKIWRGTSRALASRPPERVRPEEACLRERLKARPRRVSESMRMRTCLPAWTICLQRSMVEVATAMWRSMGWSFEEAKTWARGWPWGSRPRAEKVRLKSVTSSGRSSMSRPRTVTSGWLSATARAMSLRSEVLPALGGETMRARWPLPSGQKRSMRRQESGQPGYSRVRRGCGSMEVSSSKGLMMGVVEGLKEGMEGASGAEDRWGGYAPWCWLGWACWLWRFGPPRLRERRVLTEDLAKGGGVMASASPESMRVSQEESMRPRRVEERREE